MNILFHSSQPAQRYGGVAAWSRHVVAALRAQGHRVHVLAWGRTAPDAQVWGPDLHFLPLPARRLARLPIVSFWTILLAASRAAHRLLPELDVQVVHTVSVYDAFGAALARGRSPAALVLSIHGDFRTEQAQWWKSRWRRRMLLPVERAALRNCQAVTTSSAWLQERLAGPLRHTRAVVIPNGISEPEAPTLPPSRRDLGLPDNRRIALTLNSLYAPYRRQGLELLIAAAPAILEQASDLLFLVVGGVNDPVRDRELVAWAQGQAAGLPFLFTGYRQQPPADLMRAADLYVHPSFLDNSPTAVLEAMILARPIVATRVGGIPELLDDGETGMLVPPEPGPLAQAVVRLLADPSAARDLAARARRKALSDFTWTRTAERFSTLYAEAVATRRAGAA